MALRWFSTVGSQIARQVSNGCPKDPSAKGSMDLTRMRHVEEAMKNSSLNRKIEVFRMPLDYPRYKKEDYERMEEWRVDQLLREYGLNSAGSLEEKRAFAMGAFLWSDQY
ncbi:Melanin-concentrating hormone receptor 1 [Rhynchospora pubera]|uniref:Melanin-concentrating hormone receptor 1 n=1 Tax=Rhynchospora pubera TaxID=906938 RepID=A0AAV8HYS4_9POAL|nr:Melanin-concentrating hormone receptor 1 [Rhynchospora pubera]